MQDPNDKLDISSISFNDMIGDGLETETQSVEAPEPEEVEVVDEVEEDYGDVDHEEVSEMGYEEDDEERTVEDEYDDEEVELEDLPIADQISNVLGVELEAEYADTVEGLTNYVRDVSQEVAEEQLQSLFEEFPEVQRHLDYVLAGGDPEQFYAAFNPQADYSNIEMAEGDVSLQRAMLGEYFKAAGHPDEFIIGMLNDVEESGKLFSNAQVAQQQLAAAQAEEREALYANQLAAEQEAEAEQEEFWDGVADIIESGNEFGGIQIPDNDKQDFFDYISMPVDDYGNTQRDLDYQEANMDIKLAIDYLMYSGFNLADIIDTKAKTQSVMGLRDRIQSNEERVKSARKASRRQKTFDPDQLDINALF